MKKQVLLRASIVVTALLAWNGCKDSETAKDAKDDAALVLDAGQEPREALRYKVERGTSTTSVMDFAVASLATTRRAAALSVTPGVRLTVVSGPTVEGRRGSTRFDVRIIKAEAIIPERMKQSEAQELNKAVSVLNNVGGWVEVDDRGIVQRAELNEAAKRSDVPARLLVMLINARTSLARVILPAEPVGVGAKWQARKELLLYGFQVDQTDTYTLTEMVGDELKLDVQIEQTAPAQTVTFEKEGVELSVESYAMNTSGNVIVNLAALEANASARGESAGVMNVKTVDGSEKIEINRAVQIRMTVTYNLATFEADEATEKAKATQEAAKETGKELNKELDKAQE